MKFFMILAVFLMFFAMPTLSMADDRLFVGVSPPIVDLGILERGTTNVVKFYAVTVSDQPLVVFLECENGRLDFFNNHYKDSIFNFSEEDTVSWVKFISNPVELRPQNNSLSTDYESIKGWREVSFLLDVPNNAEPGYHLIRVKPNPQETSTQSTGTMVVAVTSINIIFNVSGEAQRKGVILDTVNEGTGSNTMRMNTYFQNIGTETISAKSTQMVYDKDDRLLKEVVSATKLVKPKEISNLVGIMPLSGVPLGDYKVLTTVSYTTDSAYKNSTLSITQNSIKAPVKSEDYTIWVFILAIIIIAIVIYRWVS
jgi:hypothetical protein